jgi:hypothetical protein
MKFSRLTLMAVFAGVIVVSGCSGTEQPTQPPEPVVDLQPEPTEVAAVEGDQELEDPAPIPTQPTTSQPVAPTPTLAPPAVKTGLEATDPNAVNLASGNPTLVEFFAFW